MLITIGRGLSRLQRQASAIPPSLKDIVPSCIFDVDATQPASYGGSGQTWYNLVAAPADGSAQANHHFYLGASATATTDDPTFNGTVGNAAAYFSCDGGDYFDAASMPTGAYLRNAHRTDSSRPITIGFAFRTPGALSTQAQIIATNNASTTHGFRVRLDTDGSIDFSQSAGSGFHTITLAASGSLIVNTNYVLLVSFNSGAAGSEKYWLNATNGNNWVNTYAPNAGSTASHGATIGALPTSHSNALVNGTRLYGVYLFNEIIDNTKAAAIIAALENRHGRDYTP